MQKWNFNPCKKIKNINLEINITPNLKYFDYYTLALFFENNNVRQLKRKNFSKIFHVQRYKLCVPTVMNCYIFFFFCINTTKHEQDDYD